VSIKWNRKPRKANPKFLLLLVNFAIRPRREKVNIAMSRICPIKEAVKK
jgi:hypothetical protein